MEALTGLLLLLSRVPMRQAARAWLCLFAMPQREEEST